MPNKKGCRKPNGRWQENTPERRKQKREAAARYRQRRANDAAWKKSHAEAQQKSRRQSDPNRERFQKYFRFKKFHHFAELAGFHTTGGRHVDYPELKFRGPNGGIRRDNYLTAEELIASWQEEKQCGNAASKNSKGNCGANS